MLLRHSLLLAAALPAFAQADRAAAQETVPQAESGGSADAVAPAPAGSRVFEPAYFAQYAPRNALDMVQRIPGFSISDGNGSQRGLGQVDQNVLVNGERFSSKSDSVRDQLARIPADDVVRIELVDGTTLDIPGLSGLVANVVYVSSGASGQFRWRTGFRAFNTEAQLFGGEVSLTGSSGALDYTVSLSNENNRFGADGPIIVTDRFGNPIETQDTKFTGGFDNPKLATNLTYRFSDVVVANLNLAYGEDFFFRDEPEIGRPVLGPVRTRLAEIREDGPEYEIGADIQFPLGPGTMKLIGLERFERDNFSSLVTDAFDDGRPTVGNRFTQTNGAGERIGRFEYGWRLFDADWQLSGEAAFNRLNRVSGLFGLNAEGDFVAIPFPAGIGGVSEDRYEAILSFSKQITSKLGIQASAGGEYSKIEQTGVGANSRTFRRPKGSVSLAWSPADDFDASVKFSRVVGQLSFGDFLASVALNDDNQNAGNNNLQPAQSWQLESEANKRLGPWGSIKLGFERKWFEDFIDFFPLATGGEARGNIGDADATRITANATLKLDPIGWAGAQFDIGAMQSWLRVTDPFTGLDRPVSNNTLNFLEVDFRHDVPNTDWAYGGGLFTAENAPYSRLFEFGRSSEGPTFLDLFVEHKDILGLTVNARIGNVLGATQKFERTVFAGPRPDSEVLFIESLDRRIGPTFRFTVSGDF